MFYNICFKVAIAIFAISLIGSFANASALTIKQQNYVDNRAQSRMTRVYVLPNPYYRYGVYTGGGSSGGGSSRSSYDGYRGGGPGSGK